MTALWFLLAFACALLVWIYVNLPPGGGGGEAAGEA